MTFLITFIIRIIGLIPLNILSIISKFMGFLSYYFLPETRHQIQQNMQQADIISDAKHIRQILSETAMSGLELSIAWTRSPVYIRSLFKEIYGFEYVQQAIESQQGILFITPHLGSYDLAGRMLAEKLPFDLTAMYRPPRKAYLEPIMQKGRQRSNGKTAPANAHGVRQIVRSLRQHEAVVILPDQVPETGEGVIVTFFNRKAYTMTLASRLANLKDVCTLFFVGERLPYGRGFILHIIPLQGLLKNDRVADTMLINHNIENLIKRFPTQYLFSYNRYRIPYGVE